MGFFVEEPAARQAPLPELVGPIVRLGVCTATEWKAVVFFATTSEDMACSYSVGDSPAETVPVDLMDTHHYQHHKWNFCRFLLPTVSFTNRPQVVHYTVICGAQRQSGRVPVPAAFEEWNLSAYSCYDQRRGVGERLWEEMSAKAQNGTRPVHALLGGGDQLYNDNLWNEPPLAAWLKKEDKVEYVPDEEMKKTIADFYAGSYLRHVHFHPAAELLRNTPQVNTWDDHDTFDGWGSYGPKLLRCPLFTRAFTESQRFYLLFQHATTASRASGDGYMVTDKDEEAPFQGFHFMSQLGPSAAVVAPDSRSQRTRKRILADETYKRMFVKMKELPQSVGHVIFLSAIPIVYPSLGLVEPLLKFFNTSGVKMLFKTGLLDAIYNEFGEPDLLDDVTDHWSSSPHAEEKAYLLEGLVHCAMVGKYRCTIVSGDVHLCAFGYLQSAGAAGSIQTRDPGFVPQIVTSGIGNKPPVDLVVKYLKKCVKQFHKVGKYQEVMGTLFKKEQTPTGSQMFNNRQNFCELKVGEAGNGPGSAPLMCSLVILGGDPIEGDEIGDEVPFEIPPLLPPDTPASTAKQYDMADVKPKKRGWFLWCQ